MELFPHSKGRGTAYGLRKKGDRTVKGWHGILPSFCMIIDILTILLSLVLGYALFLSSAYFLAKWMLPRIEDESESAKSEPVRKQTRRTASETPYRGQLQRVQLRR